MIIRHYEDKDFPGIVRVIQDTQKTDCWPQVYPQGWNEIRIKQEFDPIKKYRDPLFLVSEKDNRITGLIAGHCSGAFVGKEIPHLTGTFEKIIDLEEIPYYQRDIIVHPDFQKGIVGLMLFETLEQFAKEKGYNSLITRTPPQNHRGIRFFEYLGYEEIFRDSDPERIYFRMKI